MSGYIVRPQRRSIGPVVVSDEVIDSILPNLKKTNKYYYTKKDFYTNYFGLLVSKKEKYLHPAVYKYKLEHLTKITFTFKTLISQYTDIILPFLNENKDIIKFIFKEIIYYCNYSLYYFSLSPSVQNFFELFLKYYNKFIKDTKITSPEITSPEMTSPEMTSPEMTSPEITSPEMTSPEITRSISPSISPLLYPRSISPIFEFSEDTSYINIIKFLLNIKHINIDTKIILIISYLIKNIDICEKSTNYNFSIIKSHLNLFFIEKFTPYI